MYEIASEVSQLTGEPYHVHHAVPVRGMFPGTRERSASGLNTHQNMQVISGKDNLLLSNKFEPGAPPTNTGLRQARGLLRRTKKELGLLDMPE